MTLPEIAQRRLLSQHLSLPLTTSIKDVVGSMGAMQAQDYAMAKWAVGVRLAGSTLQSVDEAISSGEIIRTHVMRPTWHFVSSDDIYWMLALTAPRIKASMRARHRDLGLTESALEKSNGIIEKALKGGNHATRDELVTEFKRAGFANDANRASHLLMCAELDAIICSGADRNNKLTYTLLSERVPQRKTYNRDESLAMLAKKYFLSHGPATVEDFAWWSGLSLTDARNAVEMIASTVRSEVVEGQSYWFVEKEQYPPEQPSLLLLPAFDEYIISYKNRSVVLDLMHHKKAISENGIFRPVIVSNGQVIGLWKRTIKKETVIFEAELLYAVDARKKEMIAQAATEYATFLGKEVSVHITEHTGDKYPQE